ncbi:MAG TPA: chromosome segregation protein SMC [Pyrinomonadaceae bacterium]|nr:chromosome segregation protein SMC [Pyrinomonadaceae bacterium]
MFKLQRLEITGFKSFADYTEIVFTGSGITAVVGPNGCGKSNVSDCIAWVLGEQRAKSLRGGEMKDVVFQGTKNRKPSGMAEVVLHLVRSEDSFDVEADELGDIDETLNELDDQAIDVDALESDTIDGRAEDAIADASVHTNGNGFHDADLDVEKVQAAQVGSIQTVERVVKTKRHWKPRSFALDFAPGEAVSVTRRLYLSGESEYQLNGKTCRLRDIQDLFAGTGLSGAHYAIIEQGRIGQILSAKPADRRNLIEEAAGISKFRTRQRAAETRLESAKTNLGRISDIVSEIEKQANSLRRQAGKTRRYVALQEEFRGLLRKLFAAEGRHLTGLTDELAANLTRAIETEEGFVEKVSAKEEEFRHATQNARTADEKLAEVRRIHGQNALERDRAEREHRYQSEQIVNLNNRSESLQSEVAATQERIELVESELRRLIADEEKESVQAGAAEQVLLEAEGLFAAKLEDVKEIESQLDFRRSELMHHTALAERFAETERHLTHNLDRIHERDAGLKVESTRADESHYEFVATAARLMDELDSEREKLSRYQDEKKVILAAAAEAREALRISDDKLRQTQAEHARVQNRLETLRELDDKRAVYSPEIQKLFEAKVEIGVDLHGVLADFLKVDPRAERAVESLFGEFLQTVLVPTIEDSRKVSSWLASQGSGRIASMVIDRPIIATDSNFDSDVIGDLLGVAPEFRDSLCGILPREMSARLVNDIYTEGGNELLVDHEGNLRSGNLFVSGTVAADEQNASLLAFKRELADLEVASQRLFDDVASVETFNAADRTVLAEQEEKTVDLQSLIIKVERGILSLEAQERAARQDIERAERHKKIVSDELVQVAIEIEDLDKRLLEANESSASAKVKLSDVSGEIEIIVERLTEARSFSDAENAVVSEKRTIAATSGERLRAVHAAKRRVENEQKELESRLALLKLELSEIESRITTLRRSSADIADRIGSAETEITDEQAELEKAIEFVTEERERADAVSAELADVNRNSIDAANERAAVEVRQAETVTLLKNLAENCTHELSLSVEELAAAEPADPEFDLEYSRTYAEDLRTRLEGFGAINMLAVDELVEAEERLLFLTSQRQDIIDSISSAEEALREIKERSRARFKHAFEAINENFSVFFQELFGGGRGEMSLLESDDILEAGIEIVAQPPGKRLQNILLLSGGEKAMTAIALVLAIFKYRPSPFCLLDEVDAPLDDANVGRFVNKVAEMSEKTQFIVITHNKRTMEAARALYGVTMQEPGVSKVVSVKFE